MAQSGSALAWGARGRRFESFHSDQKITRKQLLMAAVFLLSGCLWLRLCRFDGVVFGGGLFVWAYAKPKK